MNETLVIGAGMGGLALAHELRKRGQQVKILEACARVGGAIASERRDGFLLECGPNSFIDRHEDFRALIRDVGLDGSVVRANPSAKARFLVCRGALEALPSHPLDLLRTPLLSRRGKLRAVAEPLLARKGRQLDATLRDFGYRHFGTEATERLLDALQTGIYAGRIDELSAASTFPKLFELEREWRSIAWGMLRSQKPRPPRSGTATFVEGMGALPLAISKHLGDAIELNQPVQSIAIGNGWRVRTSAGPLETEKLVLAIHPHRAAELVRPFDGELADLLAGIPHAPMAIVHLGFRRAAVAHPLSGFGFLAPEIEGQKLLGCIFSSSLFPGRAPQEHVLLTALLGGRRNAEQIERSDAELVALACEGLGALLGIRAPPVMSHLVRHRLGIPQYTVGHQARLDAIGRRLAGHRGLHLTGWGYRGVGVLDVFADARALAARLDETRPNAPR